MLHISFTLISSSITLNWLAIDQIEQLSTDTNTVTLKKIIVFFVYWATITQIIGVKNGENRCEMTSFMSETSEIFTVLVHIKQFGYRENPSFAAVCVALYCSTSDPKGEHGVLYLYELL